MVNKRYVDGMEDRLHNRLDTLTDNLWTLGDRIAELGERHDRLMRYLDLEETTTPSVIYIRRRVATKQKQETKGVKNG